MRLKIFTIFVGVAFLHLALFSIMAFTGGCRTSQALENRTFIPAASPAPVIETDLSTPIDFSTSGDDIVGPESISPVTVEAKTIQYTVKKGDSFWKIARKYSVSMKELASYNNMPLTKALKAGTVLEIPPGGFIAASQSPVKAKPIVVGGIKSKGKKRYSTYSNKVNVPEDGMKYTVKSGDSLWKIAVKHNLKTSTLAAANNIDKKTQLKIGQTLFIPGGKTKSKSTRAARKASTPVVKDEIPEEDTDSKPAKSEDEELLDLLNKNSQDSTDNMLKNLTDPESNESVDSITGDKASNVLKGEDVEIDQEITIEKLAAKYGVKPEDIKKLNPGLPQNGKLTPGMIIAIP